MKLPLSRVSKYKDVVTYSFLEEDSTGPLALAVSEDVHFVLVGISAILFLRIRI
jgi:hypothetical protein